MRKLRFGSSLQSCANYMAEISQDNPAYEGLILLLAISGNDLTRLKDMVDCSRGHIRGMYRGAIPPSHRFCCYCEILTDGLVGFHNLRPDVYAEYRQNRIKELLTPSEQLRITTLRLEIEQPDFVMPRHDEFLPEPYRPSISKPDY
jgi:hypothetical protein